MKRILLAVVLMCFCAGSALGAVRYTAGGRIGTTLGGLTEQQETVYGGVAAVHFNDAFAVELAVFHFEDHPTEERLGIKVNAELPITPVQLSLRYTRSVLSPRFQVYMLGGYGYYFSEDTHYGIKGLTPDGPVVQTGPLDIDMRNAQGYHLAAGAEWQLLESLAAVIEYRYAFMDTDATISGLASTTAEGDAAIQSFEKDFWDNYEMGVLQVGLNWTF